MLPTTQKGQVKVKPLYFGPGIRMFSLLLFSGASTATGLASEVTLAWDGKSDPSLAGYIIYHGAGPRDYSSSIKIGKQTTYKVTNLPVGAHYFAVTAHYVGGHETELSNEVSTTIGISVSDRSAPLISSIQVTDITHQSARISWITNEKSDAQVEYGTTTSYGHLSPPQATLGTSHSVQLFGLRSQTLHYFRVRSRDAVGNLAVSTHFSFGTLLPPFNAPDHKLGLPRRF
jgi:Purple acid Phosphatase, N-terminal domain